MIEPTVLVMEHDRWSLPRVGWHAFPLASLVVFYHKQAAIFLSCTEHLRQQLEETLNEFEVDLVLSGHVHSYARTCNVLDGNCIPLPDGGCALILRECPVSLT